LSGELRDRKAGTRRRYRRKARENEKQEKEDYETIVESLEV
jgi:hypothetical protein